METGVQTAKGFIAICGGIIAGLLGGYDSLLKLYVGLMVVDFLLGCIKGIKAKNFSSAIALWGFVNKAVALSIIALCVLLDDVLGKALFLRNIAIMWFSICEGASILENLTVIGIPFPEGLREVLIQTKKGFSINFSQVVGQIIKNYKLPSGNEEGKDYGAEPDSADKQG